MKKIFLSFTATLSALAAGKISDKELTDGFFMFGCVRDHAFLKNEAGEPVLGKEGAEAHPKLVAAIMVAESEGRAGWIRPSPRERLNDWEVLNGMLAKNGLKPLEALCDSVRFTYDSLQASIRTSGLPLQPVY